MIARQACWVGKAIGILLTIHILADLFRPEFVPVNADSEVIAHEGSVVVSGIHLLVNILIIVPALCSLYFGRSDFRRTTWFALLASLLMLTVLTSLVQVDVWRPFIYSVLLALVLLAATIFVASDDAEHGGYRDFLSFVCLGCGLALAIAILLGEYTYGRLSSRAGPNYWGMVATIGFALSPAVSTKSRRYALMAISWSTLILTSARGAMVATVASACVMLVVLICRSDSRKRVRIYSAALCGLLILPLVFPVIADKILNINDPRRGLNSGFTGRDDAWRQALQLFIDNPLTGVGYRSHEEYITVATSSHQAYLAILAELGGFGLIVFLVIVIGAFAREFTRALLTGDRSSIASSAFLASFLVIGLTENFALAMGLPMPMAMLFIAAFAWRQDVSRRGQSKRLSQKSSRRRRSPQTVSRKFPRPVTIIQRSTS